MAGRALAGGWQTGPAVPTRARPALTKMASSSKARTSRAPWRIDAAYRFFELFDLKNIPKAELFTYFTKKNALCLTPPPKAYPRRKALAGVLPPPRAQILLASHLGQGAFCRLGQLDPTLVDRRCAATAAPRRHSRPRHWRPARQRLAAVEAPDQEAARAGAQAPRVFPT